MAAIQALQESSKTGVADIKQATALADQATMAQRFEVGLTRASELSATSLQGVEEAKRKTIVSQRAELKTLDIPEVEVKPSPGSSGFGQEVINYLDGFRQRSDAYVSELNGVVERLQEKPVEKASGGLDSAKTEDKGLTTAEALRLMQHSYQFAMEAHLVSNAASQSTRVFNELMKGQ